MIAAGKVLGVAELVAELRPLRRAGRCVVFTNGCFDLLHAGHIALLEACRAAGDLLVVGLNSDSSVRRLKGPRRPAVPAADRARVLAALRTVDYVVVFEEDTPHELIAAIEPDILAKGEDYALGEIVGRDVVEAGGGRVLRIPLVPGYSTSELLRRLGG